MPTWLDSTNDIFTSDNAIARLRELRQRPEVPLCGFAGFLGDLHGRPVRLPRARGAEHVDELHQKKKLLLEISRHFAELVRRVRGMNQRISILFIKQRIQLFFLHGSRSMIKMETLYNEPSATNIYLGASASANLGANEYYCLKGGVASLSSKGLTSCRRLPLLVKS